MKTPRLPATERWLKLLAMLATFAVVATQAGCALARFIVLRDNVRDLNESATLVGWAAGASTVVALRTDEGAPKPVLQTTAGPDGFFMLRLPADGRYAVLAFEDRNGNRVPDDGEPWTGLGDVEPKRDAQYTDVGTLPPLAPTALPTAWRAPVHQGLARTDAALAIGEVTTLADRRFTAEAGQQGLWAPSDFLRRVGMGLFLLAPHDAAKTPVVFVSGAGGSPSEWAEAIGAMDTTRFEPWLFLYPSGLRLEDSAMALCALVGHLQQTLDVARVDLVAHSMGGLVARDCLRRSAAGEAPVRVRHFVALATPWGGLGTAVAGVRYAPATVPAWNDLVPGSPFLKRLLQAPLPEGARFSLMVAARDGIVSAASARDPAALRQAREVAAFGADHATILSSPPVLAALNATLATP